MTKSLFKGDVSAPLSKDEIKEFTKKFDIDLDLSTKERKSLAIKMGLPAESTEKQVAEALLKEAGQEITQEKNTDAIVLNQAKNTQKTA